MYGSRVRIKLLLHDYKLLLSILNLLFRKRRFADFLSLATLQRRRDERTPVAVFVKGHAASVRRRFLYLVQD
jgi:hypothetical protein